MQRFIDFRSDPETDPFVQFECKNNISDFYSKSNLFFSVKKKKIKRKPFENTIFLFQFCFFKVVYIIPMLLFSNVGISKSNKLLYILSQVEIKVIARVIVVYISQSMLETKKFYSAI